MRYYKIEFKGLFKNITLDKIYDSKADRELIKFLRLHIYPIYPIIEMQSDTEIKNLKISNVYRQETFPAVPTIQFREGCKVDNIKIEI